MNEYGLPEIKPINFKSGRKPKNDPSPRIMCDDLKDIPGFEGRYAASPDGRIWSYFSEQWMTGRSSDGGRLYLDLQKQGSRRKYYIHRLVALAYLPNPEGHENVIHKNDVKTDNSVGNLEWAPSDKAAKIGDTYELLTIRNITKCSDGHAKYDCLCACGNEKQVSSQHWKTIKSCGCITQKSNSEYKPDSWQYEEEQERKRTAVIQQLLCMSWGTNAQAR